MGNSIGNRKVIIFRGIDSVEEISEASKIIRKRLSFYKKKRSNYLALGEIDENDIDYLRWHNYDVDLK